MLLLHLLNQIYWQMQDYIRHLYNLIGISTQKNEQIIIKSI